MSTTEAIRGAAERLGPGPLTEAGLIEHVHPLFSRVLGRKNDEIYLANHSLGRPLDATALDVQEGLDAWYDAMDGAWGPWLAERDACRERVARLIGRADPAAVIAKASAAQGLRAVLNALPSRLPRVATTRGEFDSIDFVLKAYAHRGRAQVDWTPCDEDGRFHADHLIDAVKPGVDLVVVSRVFFATGQILADLDRVIAHAHGVGASVLVDAYHAIGVLPLSMDELGCDAMIGGGYKYTRGGPGACWLALADSMLSPGGIPAVDGPAPLDTGWFAKREPFAYQRSELPDYAAGGDAWLEATPPVLTPYQARAGLELTLALGVDRLRAYSLGQLAHLREALHARGVATRSMHPDPAMSGAYLLVPAQDGKQAVGALRRAGVNADARPSPAGEPWFVRFCPDVLNTKAELTEAAARTARALAPSTVPG